MQSEEALLAVGPVLSHGSGGHIGSSDSNRTRRRSGALACVLVAVLSGAPEARAQSVDFGSLINYVTTLGLDANTEGALTFNLIQALQSYDQSFPCDAVSTLGDGVGLIQALRNPIGPATADDLFVHFWRLRHAILESLPPGVTCPGFEAIGALPSVQLGQNDVTGLSGEIHFGVPNLSGVAQDASVWMRVEMPGLEGREGETGAPAIPVYRRLVAVPRGASVSIALSQPPEVAHVIKAKLAPFIKIQLEDVDPGEPLPGTFIPDLAPDPAVYSQDDYSPTEVVRIVATTRLRDLDVAMLEVAAGQFNPVQEELRLFEGVSWTIQFNGGDGTFVPDRGPFESAGSLYDTTLNRDGLDYVPYDNPVPVLLGEELMILTHPNFLGAANDLANWKNSRGIPTNIFLVGAETERETPGEIRDLIWEHLLTALTPPSYVLLLGDVEYIPTWIIPRDAPCPTCSPDEQETATDLPYVMSIPYLAVPLPSATIGRIPVIHSGNAAKIVTDSIKLYDATSPSEDPLHQTVSLAAGSPCNPAEPGEIYKWFTGFPEEVVPTLEGAGKSVDRIYNLECSTSFTPTYFSDFNPPPYEKHTPMASAIGAGSGFAWDGDAAQITDALTEGRLFSAYIGHAGPGGWADPHLSNEDIQTNLTPFSNPPTVVYSLGCSSGRFDLPGGPVSFAERLIVSGHAVAVVAASRGVGLGSRLLDNLIDASWPQHDPSQGSATPLTRIGDIFNTARIQTSLSYAHVDFDDAHRYNLLGDPTAELRVVSSDLLDASGNGEYTTSDGTMSVTYPVEGAIISALQQGPSGVIPLGRAKVQNGTAQLELVNEIQEGLTVLLAASLPGGGSVPLNNATEVPSLSNWALAALAALLGVAAAAVRWRQQAHPGSGRGTGDKRRHHCA